MPTKDEMDSRIYELERDLDDSEKELDAEREKSENLTLDLERSEAALEEIQDKYRTIESMINDLYSEI